MNKLIYTGTQDALLEAAGRVVTFFENAGQVKSAASSSFSEELMRDNMPDDDHFGVHLIAMGAGEQYGPNRNGDHWPEEGLRKKHATFVTHGHFFREHHNRDPKFKIGDVKASAYNEKMRRVELIAHGDKEKAAPEYERAKSGKASHYSMSASVPYDRCSICENKATKSAFYCGDLKNFMTQWVPRHRKFAYAINDDPTFFDISDVKNPADRIAHHLQYLFGGADAGQPGQTKAASCNPAFEFSDLQAKAAGVLIPDSAALGCVEVAHRRCLEKLASMEAYLEAVRKDSNQVARDEQFYFTKMAAPYAMEADVLTDEHLQAMREADPSALFSSLAKSGVVLPLLPFYAYVTNQSLKEAEANPVFKSAASQLPEIFRALSGSEADPQLENMLAPGNCACEKSDPVQGLLDTVEPRLSLHNPPDVKVRILRISLVTPDGASVCKEASSPIADASVTALLKSYALYKTAYLAAQDTVDDATTLLVAFPRIR